MREELLMKATQLLHQLGGGEERRTQLGGNPQLYNDQHGGGILPKNTTDYEQYKLYKKYKRKYKELLLRNKA